MVPVIRLITSVFVGILGSAWMVKGAGPALNPTPPLKGTNLPFPLAFGADAGAEAGPSGEGTGPGGGETGPGEGIGGSNDGPGPPEGEEDDGEEDDGEGSEEEEGEEDDGEGGNGASASAVASISATVPSRSSRSSAEVRYRDHSTSHLGRGPEPKIARYRRYKPWRRSLPASSSLEGSTTRWRGEASCRRPRTA
jgi:hypothetical protein